jgi:hypothetical protein
MALIYNVTVKVDQSIANDWLEWLTNEHIPEIMATNCFTDYKLVRLLETDDSEGPTYAIQYFADSRTDYDRYIGSYAPALRKKTTEKWGERFYAFRSLLEVVK